MSAVRRALPLWLVLVAAYAVVLVVPGGRDVRGPEAQRLLVAAAIVEDGSVDTRHRYEARTWRAWPGAPSALKTNFGGGSCGCSVRIGHELSYRFSTGSTATRSMLA